MSMRRPPRTVRGRLRRRARPAALALAAVLLTAAAPVPSHDVARRTAAAPAPSHRLPPPAADACPGDRQDGGWTLSATAIDPSDSYYAIVGNGYLGARIPPHGSGYQATRARTGWPLFTPRYAGSFVSGLYAHNRRTTGGRQVIAALPAWTALTVTAGTDTFTPATPRARVSHYRQTLYLRCGLVRTSLTWTTADGRATDLVYDVVTDRAAPHTAAVRLRITPHWSGRATVTDLIDGRGARMMSATGTRALPGGRTMAVGFRTDGTHTAGTIASTLRAGPGTRVLATRRAAAARSLTGRQSIGLAVRRGHTATVTKYVGIDTALTSRAPGATAPAAARRAAALGWPALTAENAAAWAPLWRGGIRVTGHPDLQAWVRSSEYGLLTSLRPGLANSIAPTGLTSDNYAGLVFWDAETWMFPSVLAFHPRLARSIVDYRFRTRAAARANARRLGYPGLFFPWESGSTGDLAGECQSWQPPHCLTQIHLQSDIALAVWQYYQATGDTAWLRDRGWPLLRGIAEFWAGRVTRDTDGSYSIRDVAGPDEYSNGVTDGVFTNAGAATALRDATRAARILGRTAPATWTTIADRLRIPYDSRTHAFPQYQGYRGSLIKQADAVMLLYPLGWPMSRARAAGTLDYYARRTDPDGPAMTDSIHAVDAAAVGAPGCSTYTYLTRSIEPFVRGPFDEFSEARGGKAGAADPLAGAPAQDFLTGAGGFLQTFPYGLAGLRWETGAVRLDPMLPPQLAAGVTLRGLRYRGRTFDVALGAHHTTVRLTSGRPLTVDTPQGRLVVSEAAPVVLKTRRPDLAATGDLARCAPATADSRQPGRDADAAVDGSDATAWVPDAARATLRIDLGRADRITRISPRWTSAPRSYAVAGSLDGVHWRPVALRPGTGAPAHALAARYLRLTVRSAPTRRSGVSELIVTGTPGP